MADKMQQYVSVNRKMPDSRPVKQRTLDHHEVYKRVESAEMQKQAARCEQCGVPFCQVYCPLGNNIPDWLKAAAEGRLEEAYQLSQATNNMPEICGRICPQDRLCEAKWACTLEQAGHGTVTIGAVEKFLTENAWENGWVKSRLAYKELSTSVAIVGAGPAGMAAAEELRALGHQVHLFDRYGKIGGLMLYGIPGFKLEKHVIERRASLLLQAGVNFHPNAELGRNIHFDRLRQEYDAVLLAYGAYKARDLDVPGTELPGVVPALDYLVDNSRFNINEIPLLEHNVVGKKVVVIGGGDTAMDCVRTAIRNKASSVKCLYRRDKENMPGSSREREFAEEEGVGFEWQIQPNSFRYAEVEFVETIHETIALGETLQVNAVRTDLRQLDGKDRMHPVPIEGSEFTISADVIINALGFSVVDAGAYSNGQVKMSAHGTIQTNAKDYTTNMTGVFAAGDAFRGPSLVVWAIKDGRDVASSIHSFLEVF